MGEYDDNIQHYAPVLRRIIILVAVITAVPVVLWTITAFMRTYIAQPTVPDAKPLAVVTSNATPANTATDAAPAQNQGPTASIAATTPGAGAAGATAADDPNKGNRTNDGPGNNAPDGKPTATAVSQPASTPSTSPWPSTPPTVTATTQPSPTAANVFPDPPALAAPTTSQQAGPATTPDLAADDSLPPPDPITGPVPMPRHRPSVLALADTGSIPLPRARPAGAPVPTDTVTDAPPPVYDPGIGGAR